MTILDHPFYCFFAFTGTVLALGVWLGCLLRAWQVKRLRSILEIERSWPR